MKAYTILNATDTISHRCASICGTFHGSSWLFDKVVRYFEAEPAAESITFPVMIGSPVLKAGEATIHRDGSFEMRTI